MRRSPSEANHCRDFGVEAATVSRNTGPARRAVSPGEASQAPASPGRPEGRVHEQGADEYAAREDGDGLCPRGWPWQPADGTHRPPRQAGGLFRRQVADHRLRPVQCPELRHPPHRGRHAVQGAQPDPPSAAGLELLPAGAQRELRHPAGQPARRRGHGTPAPPTPCTRTSTSSRATPRATSSCWRATTSTRWTTRRCCSSTSSPAPT